MIRKEIDIHLEALAGFINDDDKLVTYKWLSKELGIHVNLAKQILFEYWENWRKENDTITATFLLMGYLDDGGMRVEVVKEADLPAARKNLKKIITEHIYSLQKTLPEIELLAITERGDSQHSAVRCEECVIRSEHEMEVLRWGSRLPVNKPVNNLQNSTSKVQKQTNVQTKPAEQTNDAAKESTATTTSVNKPAERTQKSAFNNMFAKAIDKQNKEKAASNNIKSKGTVAKSSPPKNAWFEAAKKPKGVKEQSASNNESIVNEKSSKQEKGSVPIVADNLKSKMAGSSNRSDDSPPEKNSWFGAKKKAKSEKDEPENSNGSTNAVKENKRKEESPERRESGEKEPKKNSGSSINGGKKKPLSRGKKRQSSAKKESDSKRRKRIVVAESSEESSNSETEDVEEPDCGEEQQVADKIARCPSPPLVKCEGGRRKVRKLVDKTFMDEDGYFVTQKEYIYESCSDKEEEMQVDVIQPSTSEPQIKHTNKRKQATLLNFFRKS